MTKDEALKRGMELLRSNISAQQWFELQLEITVIKEVLAQPEQEPWCMKMNGCKTKCEDCPDEAAKPEQEPVAHWSDCAVHSEPAYPKGECDCGGFSPKRPWVGLTDAEAQLIYDMGRTPSGMMEMVEAKLEEKNYGL